MSESNHIRAPRKTPVDWWNDNRKAILKEYDRIAKREKLPKFYRESDNDSDLFLSKKDRNTLKKKTRAVQIETLRNQQEHLLKAMQESGRFDGRLSIHPSRELWSGSLPILPDLWASDEQGPTVELPEWYRELQDYDVYEGRETSGESGDIEKLFSLVDRNVSICVALHTGENWRNLIGKIGLTKIKSLVLRPIGIEPLRVAKRHAPWLFPPDFVRELIGSLERIQSFAERGPSRPVVVAPFPALSPVMGTYIGNSPSSKAAVGIFFRSRWAVSEGDARHAFLGAALDAGVQRLGIRNETLYEPSELTANPTTVGKVARRLAKQLWLPEASIRKPLRSKAAEVMPIDYYVKQLRNL